MGKIHSKQSAPSYSQRIDQICFRYFDGYKNGTRAFRREVRQAFIREIRVPAIKETVGPSFVRPVLGFLPRPVQLQKMTEEKIKKNLEEKGRVRLPDGSILVRGAPVRQANEAPRRRSRLNPRRRAKLNARRRADEWRASPDQHDVMTTRGMIRRARINSAVMAVELFSGIISVATDTVDLLRSFANLVYMLIFDETESALIARIVGYINDHRGSDLTPFHTLLKWNSDSFVRSSALFVYGTMFLKRRMRPPQNQVSEALTDFFIHEGVSNMLPPDANSQFVSRYEAVFDLYSGIEIGTYDSILLMEGDRFLRMLERRIVRELTRLRGIRLLYNLVSTVNSLPPVRLVTGSLRVLPVTGHLAQSLARIASPSITHSVGTREDRSMFREFVMALDNLDFNLMLEAGRDSLIRRGVVRNQDDENRPEPRFREL